jgi:hypothetical protein
MSAQGEFYDDDTFPDKNEAENYRYNRSASGFLQRVENVERVPIPREGAKFPGEIAGMLPILSEKIGEVMNISRDLQGLPTDTRSGTMGAQRIKLGLTGNETIFDNLSAAKRKIGKMIVPAIQKTKTPEQILGVIGNQSVKGGVEIAGARGEDIFPRPSDTPEIREAKQQSIATLTNLLENEDLTKYDVAVGESTQNATARQANFEQWSFLAQARPDIPTPFLVDLSDMPQEDKDNYKRLLQQQAEAQQQAEQQKQQTEIQKTQIAQQGDRADVAAAAVNQGGGAIG